MIRLREWKLRWRMLLLLVVICGPILMMGGAAWRLCARNADVRRAWSDWRQQTAPKEPSHNLQRFRSESNSFERHGLTLPLLGYQDAAGEVVIEPRFAACGETFYEGLAWANEPKGPSGYINPDGSWAIVVSGETHSDFRAGFGEFQVIGEDGYPMHGFVNRQGVEVVPPKYRRATRYVDGYVMVEQRTAIGRLADLIGREVGVFPRSCVETKVLILDEGGQPTSLPSRR